MHQLLVVHISSHWKKSKVYTHREEMFAKEIGDAIEVRYTTLEKYVKHQYVSITNTWAATTYLVRTSTLE